MDPRFKNEALASSRNVLIVVACGGLLLYGVLNAFLGAAMPQLRARLGLTPGQCGLLFSFLYVPQILVVSAIGPFVDSFGTRFAFFLGALLCVGGFAGAGYADSYGLLAQAMLLLGAGGSLLSAASNTSLADLYSSNPGSGLNIGHALFGVGAVSFPAAVVLTEDRFGLSPAIGVALLVSGCIAVLACGCRFPAHRVGRTYNWRAAREAIVAPAALILSSVVFLTTALAASVGGWLRLYAEQEFSASGSASGWMLALFWGLTMTGRFASSQVLKFVRGAQLVFWCSVGMLVGSSILTMAPGKAVAVVGVIVCGLSYGPIYPTTVGAVSRHFHKYFASVFGSLQAAGLTGGMLLPAAIGWAAKATSLRFAFWLLVAASGLLTVLQALFIEYEQRKARPEREP
ncbi:MAG: sugar MFS transporter [Terriglobia bacterium]